MQIRLLSPFQLYKTNQIVSLAIDWERYLIRTGQATYDLTGGIPYVAPAAARRLVPASLVLDGSGVVLGVEGPGGNLIPVGGSASAPGAPTGLTLTAGAGAVVAAFSAPGSNGGSTITGYIVTLSNGDTGTGSASPITVTTAGGVAVTATVKAINAVAPTGGPASAVSNSVTPTVPVVPVAPAVLTQAAITGVPKEGVPLAITGATFSGAPTPTVSRVIRMDGVQVAIGNQSTTYTPPVGVSAGKIPSVTDTASNGVGSSAVSTAAGIAVATAAARAFSVAESFAQGEQVTYAGGLYTFTAAHPAGNWTGTDVTYNGQSGTRALNTVGFSKPLGVVSSFSSGTMDTATTTVAGGSRGGKCQMEAPFTKLKVMRYQREAAPARGLAISLASTETDSFSNLSNAVDPIVNGTPYNVLRANSPYGFARVTWNGQPRSPAQAPAAVSAPGQGYVTNMSTVTSDWVDCNSVTPLNGKLPMVVIRYNGISNAGDVGSNASQTTLGAMYNNWLSGAPNGRFLVAPNVGAGDHVADPTLSRSGATLYDPALYNTGIWQNIGIAAEHGVPTRVFAGFGDSITEGYSWWQNAVLTLSTQKAPCYIANFGCSTNRSAQYLELLKTQLREENYFTDVILPSFSPNEVPVMTDALADGFIVGLQEAIALCAAYNKRLYIWTSYANKTSRYNGNSTYTAAIRKINNWVRAEAAKAGALFNLIEIEAGWDNATMIVTANSDFTHPNATAGIPYMTAQCLPAIQLGA